MLVEMEKVTDEQYEQFIEGFAAAGGYVDDLENPFPLCAPWCHGDYMEFEGSTPAEWGAEYWRSIKAHAVRVLKECAGKGDEDARRWLKAHRYKLA